MKYVYPVILYKDKKLPDTWTAIFPDVEGAATCGYSLFETLEMAEDALAGTLVSWEDSQNGESSPMSNRITEPTPVEELDVKPDAYSEKVMTTLIKVDTDVYREVLKNLPARGECEEDDDRELPETYVREVCRLAGIPVTA